MYDIFFDISTRDIIYANGDFVTTTNASTQNGGIIEQSRCAILVNPMLGVALEDTINSHPQEVVTEMTRWKQQCLNDGAKVANWSNTITNNKVNIQVQVSYE
jgi:hypothetical protein